MTKRSNPASFDRTRKHLGKVWGYPKQVAPVEIRTYLGSGSFTDAYLGANGKVYTETTYKDPSKALMAEFRLTLPPSLRQHCPAIEYLGKKDRAPGKDHDVFRMPRYESPPPPSEQLDALAPLSSAWNRLSFGARKDVLDIARKRADSRNKTTQKFLKLFDLLDRFLDSKGLTGACWDIPLRNLGWDGKHLIFMDVFFDPAGGGMYRRGSGSSAGSAGSAISVSASPSDHFAAAVLALDELPDRVLQKYGMSIYVKINKLAVKGSYGYTFQAPSGRILTAGAKPPDGVPFILRTGMPDIHALDTDDLWPEVEYFYDANGAVEAAVEAEIDNRVADIYKRLGLSDAETKEFAATGTARGPKYWRATAPDGAYVSIESLHGGDVQGYIGGTVGPDRGPDEIAAFLYQHGVRGKGSTRAPAAAAIANLLYATLSRITSGSGATTTGFQPPVHGVLRTAWKPVVVARSTRYITVIHTPQTGALQWVATQTDADRREVKSRPYQDTVHGAYALSADLYAEAQRFGLTIAPGIGVKVPQKSAR
jgi:hypothetical protein